MAELRARASVHSRAQSAGSVFPAWRRVLRSLQLSPKHPTCRVPVDCEDQAQNKMYEPAAWSHFEGLTVGRSWKVSSVIWML